MRDFIHLGCTPTDEPCAQVGSEGYENLARLECCVLREQILRTFPLPLEAAGRAGLRVASNPHDFGTYLDLVVEFDPQCQAAVDWAFLLDMGMPQFWDNEALATLCDAGYPRTRLAAEALRASQTDPAARAASAHAALDALATRTDPQI